MLTPQRRTAGINRISNAYGTKVPPVIESYIQLMVKQVRSDAHELFEDAAERELLKKLTIQDVSRGVFAGHTRQGQVTPPQVKTCKVTDRVYLAGTGRPGRETYAQEEVPIDEKHLDDDIQERVRSEIVTQTGEEDTLLLAFSEISWTEFQRATLQLDRIPNEIIHHFADFFDTAPENAPNLMLAGGFSEEDIVRIAKSVKFHSR
jgi:hypothetical protein